ncbi:MAG: hypothetical protein ACKVG0_13385, partial [Alphaproteobacteria bacterium]
MGLDIYNTLVYLSAPTLPPSGEQFMAEKIQVDIADIIENQENWWFSTSTFLLCCLVLMADGFDNQALNYTAPAVIR